MARTTLLLFLVLITPSLFAQAHGDPATGKHQTTDANSPSNGPSDVSMQHGSMDDMQMDHAHSPEHQADDQAPAQFASGTSWLPASAPQYMWMTSLRGWTVMAHGNAFITYNQQPRPVSTGKLESENWFMVMEQRKVRSATLTFKEMISAEPFTAPKRGFGQVFQTGETFHGAPLVDFQHPHDFFSEMGSLLTVPLSEHVSWLLYGAAAGEPALGPSGFPHRISAMEIPAAPLSHHVQDSTHVSFGVITTGVIAGRVKLEGSAFNGREPDEHRYNFDLGALDSFSGRLSVAAASNLTMQYSFGHLRHPEALEAGNIDRQTASVSYNRPLAHGNWATSLIWGRNDKTLLGRTQNSYLLESSLNFATKNYSFTRLELVDKDELELPASIAPVQSSFRIGGYTFGGVRDLLHNSTGQIGLGAAVTFYSKPQLLDAVYGKHPVAFQIFLRLRPGLMNMDHF